MDELIKLTSKSLNTYFTTLAQLGYKDYKSVYKLLALIFLSEMLTKFREYVTEADLRSIVNSIYCLSGTTCLIDYPEYHVEGIFNPETTIFDIFRTTEDFNFRHTEEGMYRVEE